MKRKGAVVLFLMALAIFIIGGIFVLQPSVQTPETEKVIPSSTESIGANGMNLLTIDDMDENKTANGESDTQNNASVVEEDIPFSIETIGANEAVCIGKIELKGDSVYEISASAESGEKIFVALNESDNVNSYKGIEWKQFTGISENQIQAQFTDLQTGTFYVYVGNTGQKPLINVSGIYTEQH